MTTISLTQDQLITLKAVLEIAHEADDTHDNIAEALDIPNKDRGYDDDGDELSDYDETKDPAKVKFNEVYQIIMTAE